MSGRPLEHCFICDEPTGRAGKGEDSLYCDECDKGPYCPDCFRKHHESDAKVAALLGALEELQKGIYDFAELPIYAKNFVHRITSEAIRKAKGE